MKNLSCLLAVALFVTSSNPTLASSLSAPTPLQQDGPPQGGPGKGQRPGGPGADQLKDLNLTAKQKKQVDAIFKQQREQMDKEHKNGGNDREKGMADMRRRESETDTKLKAILTKEQYTQYQAKKRDRPQPPKDGQRPSRNN